MSKLTKRILIISMIVFLAINISFAIYIFTNNGLELASGNYYYKITTIDDGTRINKWDISISGYEKKNNVEENEKNSALLNEFRSLIENISMNKVSIFYNITFLGLILIILLTALIDKYKQKINFTFIDGILGLLSLVLMYRISTVFLELSRLHLYIEHCYISLISLLISNGQ